MNKTAINILINLLENTPPETEQGFNMRWFTNDAWRVGETHVEHECRTTACLAGWAGQFIKLDGSGLLKRRRSETTIEQYQSPIQPILGYHAIGTDILGLTEEQADDLFTPMDQVSQETAFVDWEDVTPQQAIQVLKHLRDTGEVNWHILNE